MTRGKRVVGSEQLYDAVRARGLRVLDTPILIMHGATAQQKQLNHYFSFMKVQSVGGERPR